MDKKYFLLYISILLTQLLGVSCSGCKHKEKEGPIVKVDTETLFTDLEENIVERRAKQADKVFTELKNTVGLNGVVLYGEQGRIVYEKAFGWRDVRRQRNPIQVDDQFQLASVSKMFTAEAIMLLYSQGLLDYDDDVTKYIPEFPYSGITIRNLLNHRSGLSRYEVLCDDVWPDRTIPMTNEKVIELYAQYKPEPYNQPDITFHYTNINYVLLASVVERITGQHFEDYMKENIFEPLGMERSFIYSLRGVEKLNLYVDTEIQGYNLYRRGAERAQDDYLNGVVGDKVMYSTVEDLYRFHVALETCQLLPDSIQREAFEPGSPTWKRGDNYGFGWRMNLDHPNTVYHFGWWKGYRSFFIRYTGKNRVLIVLTNTDSGAGAETMWNFLNDTTLQLPEASWNKSYIR